MSTIKCDLVVRYDEARGSIVMQAVPITTNDKYFQQPHAVFAQKASELLALAPSEAEQRMGRIIFSNLDAHCQADIGIRDYVAVAKEEFAHFIATLEQRASQNDSAAAFELFQILWNAAQKEKSQALLDKADAFLTTAVALGHKDALQMSTIWPRFKGEALQLIAKG